MKKIYQSPEIIETTIVSESIVASSGQLNEGQQSGSDRGGRASSKEHSADWNNIWGN